jgi:alpha-glucosidase
LEIRAYNDGIAFRYIIPKSTPLEEILIENEDTEFHFSAEAAASARLLSNFEDRPQQENHIALSRIPSDAVIAVPLLLEQPDTGWVEISESIGKGFPKLYLNHPEGPTLISSLPPLPQDPHLALDARTPLTSSWRVLLIGETREKLVNSKLLEELSH